jgi:hypothetical protein
MEISPIPGTQDFIPVKAPTADFQLSAVVNMEPVARADHSARSGARRKAAGAEELDAEIPASTNEAADAAEDPLQPHISLFA